MEDRGQAGGQSVLGENPEFIDYLTVDQVKLVDYRSDEEPKLVEVRATAPGTNDHARMSLRYVASPSLSPPVGVELKVTTQVQTLKAATFGQPAED